MPQVSAPEESFALMCRHHGLTPVEREYQFCKRGWRFDFAWPAASFAVEIEGITRQGGRHQRLPGFLADAEKYETALNLGWTVYRVPAPWIWKGNRHIWRETTVETIKAHIAA